MVQHQWRQKLHHEPFFDEGPLEVVIESPSGREKPRQPDKQMTPLEVQKLQHEVGKVSKLLPNEGTCQ